MTNLNGINPSEPTTPLETTDYADNKDVTEELGSTITQSQIQNKQYNHDTIPAPEPTSNATTQEQPTPPNEEGHVQSDPYSVLNPLISPKPKKQFEKRSYILGVLTGAVGTLLIGLLIFGISSHTTNVRQTISPKMQEIYTTCSSVEDGNNLELSNDKKTISLGLSKYSSMEPVECLARETGMSDGTLKNIYNTTGFDGKQSADWDDYHATWSFNANRDYDHLQIVIEQVKR